MDGSGDVTISEDTVIVNLNLPKVMLKFIDEDELANSIKTELKKLL